ncbi:MAG TPA: hypothetical protein VG498_04295 [Terriglobales bacterium]|nr:hypothetical protein [Terriglobales bacterium]
MKCLRKFAREIVAASVVFLSLARPLVAQQEVYPDHFDSTAVQTQASQVTKHHNKSAVYRSTKDNNKKVQHVRAATRGAKPNRKA